MKWKRIITPILSSDLKQEDSLQKEKLKRSLSPFIFVLKLVLQQAQIMLFRTLLETFQIMAYVDDIVIATKILKALEDVFINLDDAAKTFGLKIND